MYTKSLDQQFLKELIKWGYIVTNVASTELNKQVGPTPFLSLVEGLANKPLPPNFVKRYKQARAKHLEILFGLPYLASRWINLETCLKTAISLGLESALLIKGAFPIRLNGNELTLGVSTLDRSPPGIEELLAPPILIKKVVIAEETYSTLVAMYRDYIATKNAQLETTHELEIQEDVNRFAGLTRIIAEPSAKLTANSKELIKTPVISLVNKILISGITKQATDIHIEPLKDNSRVRLRIDGLLVTSLSPFPRVIHQAVISRLKVLASLNIAESRLPQDGKFQQLYEGEEFSFRVSTIPCKYGEKAVLRILGRVNSVPPLERVVLKPDTLALILKLINNSYGMLIVSGPTNSGKSLTLYSALALLNAEDININTVEDPIEYTLDGINQVQVIREKGLDFKRALRALLRQDPDILLIGETRDSETASIAIESSLTGHLVLTTLHTNDSIAAISRLEELGVTRYLISTVLLAVISQRLLRRLCTKCKVLDTPSPQDLAFLEVDSTSLVYKASVNKNPNTCVVCQGVGYKGRVACYEVFEVGALSQDVYNNMSLHDLRSKAISQGMEDFASYSRWLILTGITSLEEVRRVFPQFSTTTQ